MKRFSVMATMLLALSLLLSLSVGTAAADEHPTAGAYDNFYWYLQTDGTLTLTTDARYTSTNIVRWNYDDAVHVVVEDNVELSMGQFEAEYNLVDTVIGSSVNISDYCFAGCEALEAITLPATMTSIGHDAFWHCYKLKEITIPEGITALGAHTFADCESLKTIHLPSTLTKIEAATFEGVGTAVSPTDIYFNGTRTQWNALTDEDNLINRTSEFTFHFLADDSTPKDGIPVNEENFPDENFRAYVEDHFDWDKDWWLTNEEREAVTSININNLGITSLDGLRFFWKLERFICHNNPVREINLHGKYYLTYVDCTFNKALTNLMLGGCPVLEEVDCSNNALEELNMVFCNNLTSLRCNNNQLQEIDLSDCENLQVLSCFNNQLSSVDISHNPKLTSVFCYNNAIKQFVRGDSKALVTLAIYENELSTLDVSGCANLQLLDCQINELTSLNITGCTELRELYCGRNKLTRLDITGQTKLVRFFCEKNQLSEINIGANVLLEDFGCGDNLLTALDVSQCTELKDFSCYTNELTKLDVSANKKLESLYCPDNQLTALSVSVNTQLKSLSCGMNKISILNVRNNPLLEELYCAYNQIKSLNLAKNPLLHHLDCNDNLLSSLSLSVNTALKEVWCSNNLLTELDLSDHPALSYLLCYSNQLESLYLSPDATLNRLDCHDNHLTSLALPNIGTFLTDNFDASGNVYEISSTPFDLANLPEGFDLSKASNWTGGTVSGCILIASDNTVTYQYDCGAGITATFTLHVGAEAIASGTLSSNITWALDNNGTLTVSGTGEIDAQNAQYPWKEYRDQINKIVITSGITGIGDNCFDYFNHVTQISLPDGLKTIGTGSFANCYLLSTIQLPASLESIGDVAFRWCSQLSSINLPASLWQIGDHAFYSCKKLSELVMVSDANTQAYTRCYEGIIYQFDLPTTIKELGQGAFSTTNIGQRTPIVPDFVLPDSTTLIEPEAFLGNSMACVKVFAWTDVSLTISSKAFADCKNLRYVLIDAENGDHVHIADDAFSGCRNDLTLVGLTYDDQNAKSIETYAVQHGLNFLANECYMGDG